MSRKPLALAPRPAASALPRLSATPPARLTNVCRHVRMQSMSAQGRTVLTDVELVMSPELSRFGYNLPRVDESLTMAAEVTEAGMLT